MRDYLEYKLKRLKLEKTFSPKTYPLFYEKDGMLIKEDKSGRKYEIALDKPFRIRIIREIS